MCRDPELEASFSFSSFVLSDDEEEGYIEIALEDGLELRVSFSSCSVPLTGLSRTTTVDSSCFDDSAFSTPSSTTNCSRQQPSSTPIKRKLNRLFDSLVSSLRRSSGGGMMMRLLIKCRSMNIRAMLATLVKPYQIIVNAPLHHKSIGIGRVIMGRSRDKKIIRNGSTRTRTRTRTSCCNEREIIADKSIQAAIAHCKTSFGQSSDFCF